MINEMPQRYKGELDMFDRLAWDLQGETPFASVYIDEAYFINETTGEEASEVFYEYYWKVRQLEDGGDIYDLVRSKIMMDESGTPVYEDYTVRAFEYFQLFPELVKIAILRDMLTEGVYA